VSPARPVAGPGGKSMILLEAAKNSRKSQLDLPTRSLACLWGFTRVADSLLWNDVPATCALTLGNVKKQDVHSFNAVK
jgi:hypothetical protein